MKTLLFPVLLISTLAILLPGTSTLHSEGQPAEESYVQILYWNNLQGQLDEDEEGMRGLAPIAAWASHNRESCRPAAAGKQDCTLSLHYGNLTAARNVGELRNALLRVQASGWPDRLFLSEGERTLLNRPAQTETPKKPAKPEKTQVPEKKEKAPAKKPAENPAKPQKKKPVKTSVKTQVKLPVKKPAKKDVQKTPEKKPEKETAPAREEDSAFQEWLQKRSIDNSEHSVWTTEDLRLGLLAYRSCEDLDTFEADAEKLSAIDLFVVLIPEFACLGRLKQPPAHPYHALTPDRLRTRTLFLFPSKRNRAWRDSSGSYLCGSLPGEACRIRFHFQGHTLLDMEGSFETFRENERNHPLPARNP